MKALLHRHALLVLAAGAIVLSGCETFSPKQPSKIITVHEIVRYPRGMKELEKEIPTFSGQRIWVNSNPFLHSKSIKKIELTPSENNPEFYDLNLELDRHGALIWMQLSVGRTREPLAFVIDGIYYRSFVITEHTDEKQTMVVIRGPFDKITADSLKEHSKNNYRYYGNDEDPGRFSLMD